MKMIEVDGHRFIPDSLPLRIYDWLSDEPGWHNQHAIAAATKADLDHVQRVLWRMKARAIVRHRVPGQWTLG